MTFLIYGFRKDGAREKLLLECSINDMFDRLENIKNLKGFQRVEAKSIGRTSLIEDLEIIN